MAAYGEEKTQTYLVMGYNNNITQQEVSPEDLDKGFPQNFVAGPYEGNRASWKDAHLLNYLLAEEDKRAFIFALLMINGILAKE